MNNLIDREQAIAALGTITMYKGMIPFNTAMERIKRMPSAELGPNLAEVGTDCISRQAVFDALRTCYDTETITMDNGDEYINYGDAVGEIEQLPPIKPIHPKKGRWIINGWAITCSECGYDMPYTVRNFCPNCGADMRGEQDE